MHIYIQTSLRINPYERITVGHSSTKAYWEEQWHSWPIGQVLKSYRHPYHTRMSTSIDCIIKNNGPKIWILIGMQEPKLPLNKDNDPQISHYIIVVVSNAQVPKCKLSSVHRWNEFGGWIVVWWWWWWCVCVCVCGGGGGGMRTWEVNRRS